MRRASAEPRNPVTLEPAVRERVDTALRDSGGLEARARGPSHLDLRVVPSHLNLRVVPSHLDLRAHLTSPFSSY